VSPRLSATLETALNVFKETPIRVKPVLELMSLTQVPVSSLQLAPETRPGTESAVDVPKESILTQVATAPLVRKTVRPAHLQLFAHRQLLASH
jgi:hypothetical protein